MNNVTQSKKNIKRTSKKVGLEVGMEERIRSGEEIEITEAIRIMELIKDNIPFEEISKITGRPLSDVEKVNDALSK